MDSPISPDRTETPDLSPSACAQLAPKNEEDVSAAATTKAFFTSGQKLVLSLIHEVLNDAFGFD